MIIDKEGNILEYGSPEEVFNSEKVVHFVSSYKGDK
jgi:hypothetical protein